MKVVFWSRLALTPRRSKNLFKQFLPQPLLSINSSCYFFIEKRKKKLWKYDEEEEEERKKEKETRVPLKAVILNITRVKKLASTLTTPSVDL